MQNLRNAIKQNEQHLEEGISDMRLWSRGVFISQEGRQYWHATIPLALNAIAAGKDVQSAITSLEMDLKLYADTRSHLTSAKGQSIEIIPLGNSVLAHGSHSGLIQQDDRIAAAKEAVLNKITAYNQLLQQFLAIHKWRHAPQLVSL